MRLKKGVKLNGIRPEITIAMMVVDSIYKEFDKELVITSGVEGKHSNRSSHYQGRAFDARTRDFGSIIIPEVQQDISRELGSDFIVLFETNHFHIEWRPEYV